jgi:hypothetical protein
MITSEQKAIIERAFEHMNGAVDGLMSQKLDALPDLLHLRVTRLAVVDARNAVLRLLTPSADARPEF